MVLELVSMEQHTLVVVVAGMLLLLLLMMVRMMRNINTAKQVMEQLFLLDRGGGSGCLLNGRIHLY